MTFPLRPDHPASSPPPASGTGSASGSGSGRSPLSIGSAALLMVGIGTAALIGLPGMSGEDAPEGVLEGTVADAEGDPVDGAPVALFDGRSNTLLEITHTDRQGRFGFHQDPGDHHIFAQAPEGSGLVGAWSQDREAGQRSLSLTLPEAVPFEAHVVDAAGQPISGAELRVYAHGITDSALGVLARARTDASGRARLSAPPQAHVAAFRPDLRHKARWSFDHTFTRPHERLEFTLHPGRPVRGCVVDDEGRPLAGVLVTSWDMSGPDAQWNGYQLTGDEGTFLFFSSEEQTLLRAVDRKQGRLPAERQVHGASDVVLALQRGNKRLIRCRDEAGLPRPARVWTWSDRASAWSWGARTDPIGQIEAALDDAHAVVVEPLESSFADLHAFDRILQHGTLEALLMTEQPALPPPSTETHADD